MYNNKKLKKYFIILLAAYFLPFLSSCGGAELENKYFPLAALIGQKGSHCQVNYLSENLAEVADEQADGDNTTTAGATAETYYESQKTFEKNNRCQLDLSHTKAVVFEHDFLKNGSLPLFLETVRREQDYAQNTLVYLTDSSMDTMAKLNDTLEIPLGSYLEQMTDNEQEMYGQSAVTLGALLKEQANSSRTLLIPVLKEANGLPVIHAYEILENFEQKGTVSPQQARFYYLISNQLQQLDMSQQEAVQARLTNLKCKRAFTQQNGIVTQKLTITADAEQITGQTTEDALEEELSRQVAETYGLLKEERQTDITDSYRHLAMRARDIYRLYESQPEAYRANLECQVQVDIRMVS